MKKTQITFLIIGVAAGIGLGITGAVTLLLPRNTLRQIDTSLMEPVAVETYAKNKITDAATGATNDHNETLWPNKPHMQLNQNEETASTYYQDLAASLSQEEADKRGLEIMEISGTWGGSGANELDYLIPHMTPEAVDRIVEIYLERHLFPGITPPEGALKVAAVVETALDYMTPEGKEQALNLLNEYL